MEGKVALITGGSRGIGLEIARQMVTQGGRVCLTARKSGPLEDVVSELAPNAIGIAGRSDDPYHQRAAVEATLTAFGRLDHLVNNAATNAQVGPLVDADLGGVTKTYAVNVIAPIGWLKEVWHQWMGAHGGSIVNVASVGGLRVSKNAGAYNTSKAALLHLTQQMAIEVAPNVRVNAVASGLVPTYFSSALVAAQGERLARAHPMGRLGTAEDVANAVNFLLSDKASWITGSVLVVDGGGTSLADVATLATDNLGG